MQHPEGLGHLHRAVVRQQHGARADAGWSRSRRPPGDQDLRRGAGEPGHAVMLGDPVALIAERLGAPGQRDGVAECFGRRHARRYRRLVEDRELQARARLTSRRSCRRRARPRARQHLLLEGMAGGRPSSTSMPSPGAVGICQRRPPPPDRRLDQTSAYQGTDPTISSWITWLGVATRNAARRRRRSGPCGLCGATPTLRPAAEAAILRPRAARRNGRCPAATMSTARRRTAARTRRGRSAARPWRSAPRRAADHGFIALGFAGRHGLLDEHRPARRERADVVAAPRRPRPAGHGNRP